MTTRIPRIDFFSPTGLPIVLHREEEEIVGAKFGRRMGASPAAGAQVIASFWRLLPSGCWEPAPEGSFADPVTFWDAGEAIARVRIAPPDSGPPAPAGQWGVKLVVTLTDERVLVADHPLHLMGAMS